MQKFAEETKKYINPSHKHFSELLKNRTQNSFFLSPTNKSEIQNIISSLDSNKSFGPNSIPTKILKLLKNFNKQKKLFKFHFDFDSISGTGSGDKDFTA